MKNIAQLISTISDVHSGLQASAANSVNRFLTLRNWLVGYYVVEYEQEGEDKATYGDNLLNVISKKLSIKGLTAPEISRCRQFYQTYNYFLGTVSQELEKTLDSSILGTASQKLKISIVKTVSPNLDNKLLVPAIVLINKLSYSHLIEIIKVADPLKRTFYELECIKCTWSVRELKRQIASLYFERSGLSSNSEKLTDLIRQKSQPQKPIDIIKNIYSFEFLDLGIQSVIEETDLEKAFLNNLQEFIVELGNGFCLEARQKRIGIGESYYFIDLVFYHRILKCHVLVELKVGEFEHGDIGQLNTYLNFFKAEISERSDNPPVGILLVAEKDSALVKYATAGMDENLFVQQYLIQLPNQELLAKHIERELREYRNV